MPNDLFPMNADTGLLRMMALGRATGKASAQRFPMMLRLPLENASWIITIANRSGMSRVTVADVMITTSVTALLESLPDDEREKLHEEYMIELSGLFDQAESNVTTE